MNNYIPENIPDLVKRPTNQIRFPYTHKRVLLIQAIAKQLAFMVGEVPEDGLRKCIEEIESAISEYRRRSIKV